jgi:hypothetical protein
VRYIFLLLLIWGQCHSSERVQQENEGFNFNQALQSLALIFYDDSLDSEVEEFLNFRLPVVWEDNAYVYLWGMGHETDDPYTTGKEILIQLLEEERLYNYEQRPLDLTFLEGYKKKSYSSELLCSKKSSDCMKTIESHSKEIENLVLKFDIEINSYLTFLKFNAYNTFAFYAMESPLPSFRTITNAQKLFHLKLLNANKPSIASEKVLSELSRLRERLSQADNLISKMVFAAMIAESVDMLNHLYAKHHINISYDLIPFSKLNSNEMSAYKALFSEFNNTHRMVYDLLNDPTRFHTVEENKTAEAVFLRLFYRFLAKPNLSLNTEFHKSLIPRLNATKFVPSQFYEHLNHLHPQKLHNPYRNFIGTVLLDYARPHYEDYQVRLFDLDMKLQLLRGRLESDSINDLLNNKNYLSSFDQSPAFIDNEKICFSGLIEENKDIRCILTYDNE